MSKRKRDGRWLNIYVKNALRFKKRNTCRTNCIHFPHRAFRTKVTNAGNRVTEYNLLGWRTSVLPLSCLNCSQWQTEPVSPLKAKTMSIKLLGASALITLHSRNASLSLLWIQPASLVFNYLSQYRCIEPYHMSKTIKCTCKSRDVAAVSEGYLKLHGWLTVQEVNKVVIWRQ